MTQPCPWYVPWSQYDSNIVKTSECHHWNSAENCERHEKPKCDKPWVKEKQDEST